MTETGPTERQRQFYQSREHRHLQATENDFYSAKLASRLADHLDIPAGARVLEVGAGFGRFTFHLLDHCESLVALDLTPAALETLESVRDRRGIDAARCTTFTADLDALEPGAFDAPFDCIVGFFLLHHLPDYARSIETLSRLLTPTGRIGFLEPNRRNPLFLVQVAACPDMTWAEEKGMFSLSRRGVESAYRRAGLQDLRTKTAGFFPPQVLNNLPAARRLEARLERFRPLQPLLPFLLMSAQAGRTTPEP